MTQSAIAPEALLHPYIVLHPGEPPASDVDPPELPDGEDAFALILPKEALPRLADGSVAQDQRVRYDDGVVTWTDARGARHQLGAPSEPFHASAAEALFSDQGLLVCFMDLSRGALHHTVVFRV